VFASPEHALDHVEHVVPVLYRGLDESYVVNFADADSVTQEVPSLAGPNGRSLFVHLNFRARRTLCRKMQNEAATE
jgi:hypothetical protein